MNRDISFLEDATVIIRNVQKRISNLDKADFLSNPDIQDSITLKILYIGEALGRISETFQQSHPELPWFEAIGMRHRLAHDYKGVDIERVWLTATQDLPELNKIIQHILSSLHK